ncbi:hypothetical protein ACFS07_01305 [Undibacterium arcticum]
MSRSHFFIPIIARKGGAAAHFQTDFKEPLGGRQPFDLNAIRLVLATKESLIRQRRIDEIPRMRVLAIEVADRR